MSDLETSVMNFQHVSKVEIKAKYTVSIEKKHYHLFSRLAPFEKIFLKTFSNAKDFYLELRWLTLLNHPSILKPVFYTNGKLGFPLLMSLKEAFSKCLITIEEVVSDLFFVLRYLHLNHLSYNNLSLENLLYDEEKKRVVIISLSCITEAFYHYPSQEYLADIPGNLGYYHGITNQLKSEMKVLKVLTSLIYHLKDFDYSRYNEFLKGKEKSFYDVPSCMSGLFSKIDQNLPFYEYYENIQSDPLILANREYFKVIPIWEKSTHLKISELDFLQTFIRERLNGVGISEENIFKILHLIYNLKTIFPKHEMLKLLELTKFLVSLRSPEAIIFDMPEMTEVLIIFQHFISLDYSMGKIAKNSNQLLSYYLCPRYSAGWTIVDFQNAETYSQKESFLSGKIEPALPDLVFQLDERMTI